MTPDEAATAIAGLMPQARTDLADLVAIRSVASVDVEPVEELRKGAGAVVALLRAAGVADAEAILTSDDSEAVIGHVPGPPGSPTVLLYAHYDVQPAGPLDAWASSPWELTERDGRWYGRGAADCKGNFVMHLLALRALPTPWPVGIRVVVEGSEEMSGKGLEDLVADRPELFAADAILIADTGNADLGTPTLTTCLRGTASVDIRIDTLAGPVHSGMFGGAAPDALAALIALLASLRGPDGETTIDGLPQDGTWSGQPYPPEQFRSDAGVLDGVELTGDAAIADALWARPALTVLAIDAPAVAQASASVQGTARALVNLRVPPGVDASEAQDLLVAHLEARVPWNARATLTRRPVGQPFAARTDGPAYEALRSAMADAFGAAPVTSGQGGSIPLTNQLQQLMPDAEIVLYGVEEPSCRIHAPNESVDPHELARTAVTELLFLSRYGAA